MIVKLLREFFMMLPPFLFFVRHARTSLIYNYYNNLSTQKIKWGESSDSPHRIIQLITRELQSASQGARCHLHTLRLYGQS